MTECVGIVPDTFGYMLGAVCAPGDPGNRDRQSDAPCLHDFDT